MKAAEGVPSGSITIFHAYCLTAERLQTPFCLPRYQQPSRRCPAPNQRLQLASTLSLR